ncbi:hypothetical protein Q9L42_008840 [Methylomarinum sp. Ch1-1]|uniref:Uncharacterized protein n=1 Tax=Methylomarinum roseum TaxID=3067653 RepID=A0AAU7NZA2_9GAMM|nr:hypothetical protein [Methylomarinum sp. Ch1-1]MDP4521660.1 hypothetical protein [Methylomarinum sp. Ch1-1]
MMFPTEIEIAAIHIFGLLMKVFIDLRALMKLSARFYLYHFADFKESSGITDFKSAGLTC